MIIINKGQINNIALNLQAVTYSSPKYLFNLVNDITNVAVNFIGTDSSSTTAYNKFSIEETTSTDFYNSKVNLNPSGFWTYNIYAQTSSTNLEPSLALNFLETGKASIVSTYSIDNIYQYEILPTYEADYIKLDDLTAYTTDVELSAAISSISNTPISINDDYTLANYKIVLCDCNSNNITISEPILKTNGMIYYIKKIDDKINIVDFNFLVDGSSLQITTQYSSYTITYLDGNWYNI